MTMQRRDFLKTVGAASAIAALPGCATTGAGGQGKVVVVGGGYGGATVANNCDLWVNGQLVHRAAHLSAMSRYQFAPINLQPHLRPGKNVIALHELLRVKDYTPICWVAGGPVPSWARATSTGATTIWPGLTTSSPALAASNFSASVSAATAGLRKGRPCRGRMPRRRRARRRRDA